MSSLSRVEPTPVTLKRDSLVLSLVDETVLFRSPTRFVVVYRTVSVCPSLRPSVCLSSADS